MARLVLQAANDRFVGVAPKGHDLVADRETRASAEAFEVLERAKGGIALRTVEGLLLTLDPKTGAVSARRGGSDRWTTFHLVDVDGGHVALRAANDRFVGLRMGGRGPLLADAADAGRWQRLRRRKPARGSTPPSPPVRPAAPSVPQPVLVVGPATGRRGEPVHLPIAVVNPDPRRLTLGEIEVSGVPAAFTVSPAMRGREHAPGYWSWTVALADLAALELVPSGEAPTGAFSLGVVATAATAADGTTRAALQFLDVTVVPTPEALRIVVDPVPARTTLRTPAGWTRVALRTADGHYVSCAGIENGGLLHARRDLVGIAETFEMVRGPGSAEVIALGGDRAPVELSSSGLSLSAAGSNTVPEPAFQVVRLDERSIAVRTADGHFLTAQGGGGGELTARATSVGPWETFVVVPLDDQPYTMFHQSLSPDRALVLEVTGSGAAQIGLSGAEHALTWERENTPSPDLVLIEASLAGTLWGLDGSGALFLRRAGSWEPVLGEFTTVSVADDGALWGISVGAQRTYVRPSGTPDFPCGDDTGLEDWVWVPGDLRQLSAGARAQVWGVEESGRVVVRTGITPALPGGTAWQAVDGTMRSVSCGGSSVWALGIDGSIWVREGVDRACSPGTGWLHVDGALQQIHVTSTGRVVGTSTDGQVWVRHGVRPDAPAGTRWLPLNGAAMTHVTASATAAWGLDAEHGVRIRRGVNAGMPGETAATALPEYELALEDSVVMLLRDGAVMTTSAANDLLSLASTPGHGWTRVPGVGPVTQVHAATDGTLWALDEHGGLQRRRGGMWEAVTGAFTALAVADDGGVWGVTTASRCYVRPADTPDFPSGDDTGASAWLPVEGEALHQVSAGAPGQVWATTVDGRVLVRAGVTRTRPQGSSWRVMDGALDSVSCAGAAVWGLTADGGVRFRDGVTATSPLGTAWRTVDGSLLQLHVTGTGRVWGIDGAGQVWVRSGVTAAALAGTGWRAVPGIALSDVTCSAAGVWGVDADQVLWSRRGASASTIWVEARGSVLRLGLGPVVGDEPLLEWQDEQVGGISRVGVRTQGGGAGRWTLSQPRYLPLGAQLMNATERSPISLSVRSTGGGEPATVDVGDVRVSAPTRPGHTLLVLDRAGLGVRCETAYDTAGDPAERRRLATDLDALADDVLVCVLTTGKAALEVSLGEALRRCGASSQIDRLVPGEWSYALVGVPGRGEGSGVEAVQDPNSGLPAVVRVLVADGVVARDDGRSWTSNSPVLGRWDASHVMVSGLPDDASLTHGERVATAPDGTTLWAVPADQVEDVGVSLPAVAADPADSGSTSSVRLALETTTSWSLGKDQAAAASASWGGTAGLVSDGLNLWAGAETTYHLEAATSADLGRGVGLVVTATVDEHAGATIAGGVGEETRFPCPACAGSGTLAGPGLTEVTCTRCSGTGTLVAPGARLHVYAGVVVSATVAVSVGFQIATNVTTSADLGATVTAGAEAFGDGEVYAGSGRFGGKGSGSTFAGAGVEARASGTAGAYGTSIAAGGGLSSPGSVGVGGGGAAVWDGDALTIGISGELGVALFGVAVDLEITLDTGPLQALVLSVWDSASGEVSATVVNGGGDALAWSEDAAYVVGGFVTDDVGGALVSFGLALQDAFTELGDDVATTANDAFAAITDGFMSVGHALDPSGW